MNLLINNNVPEPDIEEIINITKRLHDNNASVLDISLREHHNFYTLHTDERNGGIAVNCHELASKYYDEHRWFLNKYIILVSPRHHQNITVEHFQKLVNLYDEFCKKNSIKFPLSAALYTVDNQNFIALNVRVLRNGLIDRQLTLIVLKMLRGILSNNSIETLDDVIKSIVDNYLMTNVNNNDFCFLLKYYFIFTNVIIKEKITISTTSLLDNIYIFLKRNTNIIEKVITSIKNCISTVNIEPIYFLNKEKPIRVFSRHPSHRPLRNLLLNVRTLIRFGSQTPTPQLKSADLKFVEINTVEAVRNSASKFLMKACFKNQNIRTAEWTIPQNEEELRSFWVNNAAKNAKFIVKSEFGSRGEGLYLFTDLEQCVHWFQNRYGRYLIEKYYNYSREYRLHVTENGCFYTNRKMLKADATDRWYRNDSNSVWIVEENPAFDKPDNWDHIVGECVRGLKAVGLDVGAFDVRVQSKGNDFIICEVNSAPSHGNRTSHEYAKEIPKIVKQKLQKICVD